jgi:hypothetical protein
MRRVGTLGIQSVFQYVTRNEEVAGRNGHPWKNTGANVETRCPTDRGSGRRVGFNPAGNPPLGPCSRESKVPSAQPTSTTTDPAGVPVWASMDSIQRSTRPSRSSTERRSSSVGWAFSRCRSCQ